MIISRSISRSISALPGQDESPLFPDQTCSFYLDFVNKLYGDQTMELAQANTWKPAPTPSADFSSGLYFVGS